MSKDPRFSLEYYKEILESIKIGGYRFGDFIQDKGESDIFLLRHDVDKEVEYALGMAHIEKNLKIHAHYFFLIHSPLYNVMEKETWNMIYEIHSLGHTIGLHFDERKVVRESGDFKQDVLTDLGWLKSIFPFSQAIVSFHNPSENAINHKSCEHYRCAYDPQYFSGETKYISDSNRNFREKDIIEKFKSHAWPRVQMLIHPIWWFDEGNSVDGILSDLIKRRTEKIDNYLQYSNTLWNKYRSQKKQLKEDGYDH
jgi:hypothetical protein